MLLKTIVCGVALASIWLWAFSLVRKEYGMSMLRWWIKVIVPQGMVIAYALILIGLL